MRLTIGKRKQLLNYALEKTSVNCKFQKTIDVRYARVVMGISGVVKKLYPNGEIDILKKHDVARKYSNLLFMTEGDASSVTGFEYTQKEEIWLKKNRMFHNQSHVMEASKTFMDTLQSYDNAVKELEHAEEQRKSDFNAILQSVTTYKQLCEVCDIFIGAVNLVSNQQIAVVDSVVRDRVDKYRSNK